MLKPQNIGGRDENNLINIKVLSKKHHSIFCRPIINNPNANYSMRTGLLKLRLNNNITE